MKSKRDLLTEEKLNDLIVSLGDSHRREAVARLLSGNDTQCFTERQYAEMYHAVAHKDDPFHKEHWINWLTELAPKHLLSIGCVQVKPGIWTKKDNS